MPRDVNSLARTGGLKSAGVQSPLMKRFGWTEADLGTSRSVFEQRKRIGALGVGLKNASYEDYLNKIAFAKAYEEIPAFKSEVKKARKEKGSGVGFHIKKIGEGVVDAVEAGAPAAALIGGAMAVNALAAPAAAAAGSGAPVGGTALSTATNAAGATSLAPAAGLLSTGGGVSDTFLKGLLAATTVGGLITGNQAADAASDAADAQLQSVREGIDFQREALETTRGDLQPFREFGQDAQGVARQNLAAVSNLVNDPNAQAEFVQDNPFFELLADDAQRRIFNTGGASGKRFAGGTAEALQNSILLLGNNLVNQQVDRGLAVAQAGQNAVTIGANAAARQATATQNTGRTISDLITQGGNARAAGIVGESNAKTDAFQNLTDSAFEIANILSLG